VAKVFLTTTLPSVSGKTIGVNSYLGLGLCWQNDASTSAYTCDIAQVQVERGNKATPFEHRSYGEELALCQRYYTKLVCDSFSYMGQGQARTGTSYCLFGSISLPVMMRSDPALSISGMGAEPNIGATYTLSNSINTFSSRTNAGFWTPRTSGSWDANYSIMLVGTSSSSYVAADAEL